MNASEQKTDQTTGFTLIELLVVISIIAILISILLPSLSRARDAAVQTMCASNVKQIVLSATIYSDDNHSYFPSPPFNSDPAYVRESAINYGLGLAMVQGYLSAEILECPYQLDEITKVQYWNGSGWTHSTNTAFLMTRPHVTARSYWYQAQRILLDQNGDGTLDGLERDQNTDLPGKALVTDIPFWYGFSVARTRHDGINVGYIDGHVRYINKADMPTLPLGYKYEGIDLQ